MSIKVLIQTTLLWYNIMAFETTVQWRIQGRGQRLPLFLEQTETRGTEIFFKKKPPPSYLRVWMTIPFPPPPSMRSGSATAIDLPE